MPYIFYVYLYKNIQKFVLCKVLLKNLQVKNPSETAPYVQDEKNKEGSCFIWLSFSKYIILILIKITKLDNCKLKCLLKENFPKIV